MSKMKFGKQNELNNEWNEYGLVCVLLVIKSELCVW